MKVNLIFSNLAKIKGFMLIFDKFRFLILPVLYCVSIVPEVNHDYRFPKTHGKHVKYFQMPDPLLGGFAGISWTRTMLGMQSLHDIGWKDITSIYPYFY